MSNRKLKLDKTALNLNFKAVNWITLTIEYHTIHAGTDCRDTRLIIATGID